MCAKIQALEKVNKTDHRDIQIQTEEFKGEPISALHYKVREKQPKVFKQPTLIYLLNLQKLPSDRYPQGSKRADQTPAAMLNLRRFKEEIVSYGMHLLLVK